MADQKNYVVTGIGAYVQCEDNIAVLVQRDAPVPSNALPEAIAHLLSLDLIEEVDGDVEGGLAVPVPGDGSKPAKPPAKATAKTADPAPAEPQPATPAPAAPAK
jgi:hypothetical protein